jgi:DNA-binding transcriptional ArsR family regulator
VPQRTLVTKELSELFGVLAHPARVRIIEELRDGEQDVGTLARMLGMSHCAVSQQLSIMRLRRLIAERRQGKSVFYHLVQPELATWISEGLKFIAPNFENIEQLRSAVELTRSSWANKED